MDNNKSMLEDGFVDALLGGATVESLETVKKEIAAQTTSIDLTQVDPDKLKKNQNSAFVPKTS